MTLVCWNVANCFLNIGKYSNKYFDLKSSLTKDGSDLKDQCSQNKCQNFGNQHRNKCLPPQTYGTLLLLEILPHFNISLTKGHLEQIHNENENIVDISITQY